MDHGTDDLALIIKQPTIYAGQRGSFLVEHSPLKEDTSD